MPRVLFIGGVKFSERLVRELHRGPLELVGICTTSRPFGSDALDLGPLAAELKVDVRDTQEVNHRETIAWMRERSPDLIVCAGWSRLLGDELLRLAPLGVLGYHPAALPRNRGRHPIIWTLVLGLPEAGSTFFLMDSGADSGPIVSQRSIPIHPTETAGSLYTRLNDVAEEQLGEICAEIARTGGLTSHPQDHAQATYWRKRTAQDGLVDWRMSATNIDRLVRALCPPYPGAEFSIDDARVRIVSCELLEGPADLEPGRVIDVDDIEATVMTGDGALRLRCNRVLTDLLSIGDAL